MAKFVYRMQNILNIKQKLETQAKMTYSLANQKYLEQQKILQEYMVRRVGYEQHWKKLMQGNLNLQEVEHARADVNAMKTIVRRQMVEVHKAEKELKKMRMKVLALCFSMTLTVSALAGNGRLTIQAATSQESSGTKETTEKDSTTSADTAENKNQIIEIADEKAFEEFKQELAEAETKEIDELVSYTYNKGEQGE